jgi:hypothetical protein
MSFWKPAEDPGTRRLRSWVFDVGCALFAFAASFARFPSPRRRTPRTCGWLPPWSWAS